MLTQGNVDIPYSRKLSREKTFANFEVREPSAKVFTTKFGTCCTHLCLVSSNPWKFTPWNSHFLPRRFTAIRYVLYELYNTAHTAPISTFINCTWLVSAGIYMYMYAWNWYLCIHLLGRGKNSHAYTHSVQMDHRVWLNLHSLKFYCLPDNYEIIDPSLEDIKVHI